MNQKYKNARPKLEDRNAIHLPLDYSFKTLSRFSDVLTEKQRSRGDKQVMNLDEEVAEEDTVNIEKSTTTSLKLNNNLLGQWDDFSSTIHHLFVDPALTLAWIDLSFNELRTIDECLVGLPNLMMLYLHGNNIYNIQQIEVLVSLHKLKSLTLHGNPVEASPGYRFYIVSSLAHLQTFDFSGVTKEERESAECWKKLSGKKRTKKQLEELDF